jgi:hypothetical protein
MDSLLSLLAAPGVALGALAGLVLAFLFHWLAPAGTDTAAAGGWFLGLGCLAGLLWSTFTRRKQ